MKVLITVPSCPLLERPDFHAPLSDEVLYGAVCQLTGSPCPGWYRLRTPYRYEGYAPSGCLLPDEGAAERWGTLPKRVVFRQNWCDILPRPDHQAPPLLTLPRGAVVSPLRDAGEGWTEVALCDGRTGFVRAGVLEQYYETPAPLPEEALRRRLVDTALLYRGTPYRWGGKTPQGIDCSGLASMVYLLHGIVIFRNARIVSGFPIHPIPLEALRPGDLIYFTGHVAVYLGEGEYLHATGHAGSDGVAVNSLDPGDPRFRSDLSEKLLTGGSWFH